jgi:putative metallohydrolase (TIGR04338 family)
MSSYKLRDSQRSKVYKAERVLLRFAKPLREVSDVERYLKKELKRKAITSRYPDAADAFRVKDGRGTRRALAYGDHTISIPLWARNEAIVLHEAAHVITTRHINTRQAAAHGWQFCEALLVLVRFIMGAEAHDALKKSFKDNKVRFTKPRERKPLTDEQRAVLAARLAAARAAKAA